MREIIASVVFLLLLVLLLNPTGLWMPTMFHMTVLGALIAAFGAVAVFMLRERAADERESAHRDIAGRIALLAGAGVLVAGIVYQSLHDSLDSWLVAVLVVMVIAKLGTRLYSDRYQ